MIFDLNELLWEGPILERSQFDKNHSLTMMVVIIITVKNLDQCVYRLRTVPIFPLQFVSRGKDRKSWRAVTGARKSIRRGERLFFSLYLFPYVSARRLSRYFSLRTDNFKRKKALLVICACIPEPLSKPFANALLCFDFMLSRIRRFIGVCGPKSSFDLIL